MKIERIRIEAFGRLVDLDTGPTPLGDLVVVLGPNEAGKSTLFTFLTTALYGFHPASRDRNPHVPWGADEAAGSVQITRDGAPRAEVERRLRSSPTGRLTLGEEVVDLRNQPVPWAAHVPRAVFGQVFAVTLADLAALDAETWARIQDRLVGSMGSADLGSARGVAEDLEREASEIWRPNRRGNQRLRMLQDDIRSLRGRRTGALDRDRRIRTIVEERAAVEVRLRGLRAERQEHRIAIERAQTLLPIKHRLARIDGLREQAGTLDGLRGLPTEPAAELERLRSEREGLARRITALDQDRTDPEAVVARFDGPTRLLLGHGDEVARFLAVAAEAAPERRRARDLTAELEELRDRLGSVAAQVLDAPWDERLGDVVEAVSMDLLADRLRRLAALLAAAPAGAGDANAPERDRAFPTHVSTNRGVAASATALVAGVAFIASVGAGGPGLLLVVGAVLVTAGAIGMLLSLRPGRTASGPSPSAAAAARRHEVATARHEIDRMLRDLPVRRELLDPHGDALHDSLSRLRTVVGDMRTRERDLGRARERAEAADAAAVRLTATLGRNGAVGAEALAPRLERELRDAEGARQAATSAERELRRLGREREELRARDRDTAARLEALERRLAEAAPDAASPGARARVVTERIDAHRRADDLAEELERGHADLPDLVARIRAHDGDGGSWAMDDADLAARKAHMEELDERIERSIAEGEALERNAEHLREKETVDAVDSEIATLQELETRLVRERDRKWVLAKLAREADRHFREAHQPDLVRRASEHLQHLTRGRYDRLLVDETDPSGPFRIVGPSLPAPIPLAPPVSTGTLEQAYLSLRLAIVDHLDDGRDALPLFLDEALVNWDPERRERGLDVLADLSARRQLFVFTCHPELAARMEARGARLLRLTRDA